MKRFMNDGRNDQEGQELIPAHRNAGEEAPLGLSFEGGLTARPRRYSRRQAIGLLGGSLAGVSLASLGLAAPAESQAFLPFKNFDHISLEAVLGSTTGSPPPAKNRFLDGVTQNCTVGLAPHTNPPFTGTRWEAVRILGKWPEQFWFFCRGTWPRPAGAPYYEPGCRWLDGRTHNGTVGLAPHRGFPFTGTKWEVQRAFPEDQSPLGRSLVTLKCLGHLPGARWLRGFPLRPPNGTVRLEAEPGAWKVRILPK
jgi:hypothetical protein